VKLVYCEGYDYVNYCPNTSKRFLKEVKLKRIIWY
jgi:hypothetical protein